VIDDRWLHLECNDYATPDGRQLDGYYLVRRSDFVVIVAESQGKLILVREFRAGTGKVYLGFPAGYIDAGESPEQAAMRELREETGFTATSARLLGEMHAHAAWLQSRAFVVFCEAAADSNPEHMDGEIDEVALFDWEEAAQLARTGELGEMQAIAALYLARDVLGKRG
jgi:ADP-ribose pyrophosphatase